MMKNMELSAVMRVILRSSDLEMLEMVTDRILMSLSLDWFLVSCLGWIPLSFCCWRSGLK